MTLRRLLLAFLISVPVDAKVIRIDPPAPTSESSVRVVIAAGTGNGCKFVLDRVERNGPQIALLYKSTICLLTPSWFSDTVNVGLLSAGIYTISVTFDGVEMDSYDLPVADASPMLKVFPSSKVAGAIDAVQITSVPVMVLCESGNCVKPTVTLGSTVIPDRFVTVVDAHTIIATTMPHAAGFVDVTVKTLTQTITAPAAFRFRQQAGAPDPVVFERILLPMIYNGFGAYHTLWRTDVNILNATRVGFTSQDSAKPFYFINCVTQPPCPGLIAPGESVSVFDSLTEATSGLVLMPQRDFAPGLRFSYRALELHQFVQGLSSGTELPVVRERDFRTGTVDLPNVPLDHQSRIALRIYDPDSELMLMHVRLYAVGTSKPAIAEMNVVLQPPSCRTDPCDSSLPSFGLIPDLEQSFPQIAQLDQVRIEVEAAAPLRFWAFATITNNATQHVTVVTPQ